MESLGKYLKKASNALYGVVDRLVIDPISKIDFAGSYFGNPNISDFSKFAALYRNSDTYSGNTMPRNTPGKASWKGAVMEALVGAAGIGGVILMKKYGQDIASDIDAGISFAKHQALAGLDFALPAALAETDSGCTTNPSGQCVYGVDGYLINASDGRGIQIDNVVLADSNGFQLGNGWSDGSGHYKITSFSRYDSDRVVPNGTYKLRLETSTWDLIAESPSFMVNGSDVHNNYTVNGSNMSLIVDQPTPTPTPSQVVAAAKIQKDSDPIFIFGKGPADRFRWFQYQLIDGNKSNDRRAKYYLEQILWSEDGHAYNPFRVKQFEMKHGLYPIDLINVTDVGSDWMKIVKHNPNGSINGTEIVQFPKDRIPTNSTE